MKKKDLVMKWLNHQPLDATETEAFRKIEGLDSFIKITDTAKKFKAPAFDIDKNLSTLTLNIKNREQVLDTKKINHTPFKKYQNWIFKIAAVFVIGLGLYFSFFKDNSTSVSTLASEKTSITLPDTSEVILNAYSTATYDTDKWDQRRKIVLKGEAFFKVAKGKKFDVHTNTGIVSVLGTQFNIKERDGYFEVVCYEGSVRVLQNGTTIDLTAGATLSIIDGHATKGVTTTRVPDWTTSKSVFKSIPYKFVVKEFERQYGKTVLIKNIDQDILFTGNFVHSNLQTALRSITIPMRLKFVIDDNNITFYRE